MIKTLRIAVCVLFILTTALFGMTYMHVRQLSNDAVPVITFDTERIIVGLSPTDEELLEGVHAEDAEDGDLSDSVIVESISHFITPGVCNVTYAVCDSRNHVTTATRRVEYEGYTSPHFTMSDDLIFSVNEQANPFNCIGAVDVIDGDISDRIKIAATSSGYQSGVTGVYPISIQVTNSKGDVIYLDLSVTIEDTSLYGPQITLSDYLVYVEMGEEMDLRGYIQSVEATSEETGEGIKDVRIETDLNTSVPGVYQVDYRYTDEYNRKAHTMLVVIVEEAA